MRHVLNEPLRERTPQSGEFRHVDPVKSGEDHSVEGLGRAKTEKDTLRPA
jgi:hypothetical protein